MKRRSCVALSAVLSLFLILPAVGQSGENNAYQAIQDERDARQKASKIEDFIKQYSNSSHRPDVDKILVDYYMSNKDYAKIMNHADSFRLTQTSADNASKSYIFTQAMVAAASVGNGGNLSKVVEFSNYALTADPNNLTVLVMLAANNIPDPEKAMEYAQKAAAVPKPATMADAQWQTMQARIHSTLGNFYFAKQQFKEAGDSFSTALKSNPKDHTTQFRAGFASINLAGMAAQSAQTANEDLSTAIKANASANTITELTAKKAALEKEALEHRDAAIESMAKALALGGQFAPQAKQLLDSIYQSKNRSLEGEDQLIAAKKAELGVQ